VFIRKKNRTAECGAAYWKSNAIVTFPIGAPVFGHGECSRDVSSAGPRIDRVPDAADDGNQPLFSYEIQAKRIAIRFNRDRLGTVADDYAFGSLFPKVTHCCGGR
jgi:hypothetical protein